MPVTNTFVSSLHCCLDPLKAPVATFLFHLFSFLTSRAILNHVHNPTIRPPNADLKPPILVTRGSRWVLRGNTSQRRHAGVVHARRQGRIATGMDAGVAARECDVGVAKDGELLVAVEEASVGVTKADAVIARVAVGEPGDVCGSDVVA